MKFEESKTKECLMKAYVGESQARNRYTWFASRARKEGYRQIEAIFIETADNEKEHASVFYKFLVEGLGADKEAVMQVVNADYPIELSSDTYTNLINAAEGERAEFEDLYPSFAKVAEEEGYKEIAEHFRQIAKVEGKHMERYLGLAENIKAGKVFKREQKVVWKCRNCGYIVEAAEAPKKCPACSHPQEYFELFVKNW